MAAPRRRCLNCGKPLSGGPNQRTCSASCRQAVKRNRDRSSQQTFRDSHPVDPEVVSEVVKEELRPVVREAIDEHVIRAIGALVGLAPAAVEALKDDLNGDDAFARSRAAALVVKYTMANAHVTPAREDQGAGVTIINQLPDAPAPNVSASADSEPLSPSGDTRRCDTCRLERPTEDFPADGPRCAQCLAERKQAVIDSLLPPKPIRVEGTMVPVDHPGAIERAPAPASQRFPGPPDPYRFSNG